MQSLPGSGVPPAGFLFQALEQESAGIVSDVGTGVSGARHNRGQLDLAGPADTPALLVLASLSLTRALSDHQARPHRGVPSHWV